MVGGRGLTCTCSWLLCFVSRCWFFVFITGILRVFPIFCRLRLSSGRRRRHGRDGLCCYITFIFTLRTGLLAGLRLTLTWIWTFILFRRGPGGFVGSDGEAGEAQVEGLLPDHGVEVFQELSEHLLTADLLVRLSLSKLLNRISKVFYKGVW